MNRNSEGMPRAAARGRPPARCDAVVRRLRKTILDGAIPPGTRLRSQVELAAEHGCSGVTIQRALNELRQQGFVEARVRQGTFVTAQPPHLHHYGLVFPGWLKEDICTWRGLAQRAEQIQAAGSLRFSLYQGVQNSVSPHRARLLRDAGNRALAGLIFAESPYFLEGTPLLNGIGLPRVAIMSQPAFDGIPAVYYDVEGLLNLAAEVLAERGCRRVAVFCGGLPVFRRGTIRQQMKAHGLEMLPYWELPISIRESDGIMACVRLLMDRPASKRPDALVLMDGQYVEPVVTALSDAGLRVPDDLTVVAETTFPLVGPSSMPIVRLGFDIRRTLDLCMELIGRQQQGMPVARMTCVPAQREGEVQS